MKNLLISAILPLLGAGPILAQCTVAFSPATATVAAAGGTGVITVTGASTCKWTSASNADWLTVAFGQSGTGNGTIGYTAAANTAITSRSGTITAGGAAFTLTQSGASCNFSLAPNSASLPASGGSGSFNLTTNCSWTASPTADWITLTSAASGTGSSPIAYSVAPNTSTSARSGAIQVGTFSFSISQAGQCAITLNPSSVALPSNSASGTISVTASASSCDRSAATSDTWITITAGASGTGNGTVGYAVTANNSPQPRAGTINIGGALFLLSQNGSTSCGYTVSPVSGTVPASGGTGSFGIQTSCAWTAVSNNDWLSVTTATSGTGNAMVGYSAMPNQSPDARSGSISVTGQQSFVVNQAGIPCTVSLPEAASRLFSETGDTGTFDVVAPGSCTWKAVTTASWITLGTTSGFGNGSVTFTLAANNTPRQRSASIGVNNLSYTVSQNASACTFTVTPASQSVPAGGGTFSISVGTICSWTASTANSWITLTSGASGTGAGKINYSVAANTGSNPRAGGIDVGGQTVSVAQSGRSCSIALTPGADSVAGNGGSGRFAVTSGTGCSWTPASQAPWIRIVSWSNASGSGSVQYAADRNPGPDPRSGTITVGEQAFTLQQGSPRILFTAAGIVNAASFTGGAVAPGEILSIFGVGMGPADVTTLELTPAGDAITTELAGTRVFFDDVPAPLIFTSDAQLSAIVPYEVAGKAGTAIRIAYGPIQSDSITMPVAETAPGIFTAGGNGTGQAAIVNQDFSLNGAGNAAARNSVVSIYVTGAGLMDPPAGTGSIAGAALASVAAPVAVQIGGVTAPVRYAGSAPGLISGLVQINVQVPQNVAPGAAVPVVLRIGTVTASAGSTMAVR